MKSRQLGGKACGVGTARRLAFRGVPAHVLVNLFCPRLLLRPLECLGWLTTTVPAHCWNTSLGAWPAREAAAVTTSYRSAMGCTPHPLYLITPITVLHCCVLLLCPFVAAAAGRASPGTAPPSCWWATRTSCHLWVLGGLWLMHWQRACCPASTCGRSTARLPPAPSSPVHMPSTEVGRGQWGQALGTRKATG